MPSPLGERVMEMEGGQVNANVCKRGKFFLKSVPFFRERRKFFSVMLNLALNQVQGLRFQHLIRSTLLRP